MTRRVTATAFIAAAATSVLGIALTAGTAAASPPPQAVASTSSGIDHAVFVQTNKPGQNAIDAFHRAADGALTEVGSYSTGGSGGALVGGPTDPLASQGSLVYDAAHRELLAVNAGSNTLTVFGVSGDRLTRRQILPSGGVFPVSLATHGRFAYVANAGAGGSVSGFHWDRTGRLVPTAHSTRPLGLGTSAVPNFLRTPAQVGFTPDGRHLIVATKTHQTIDVFGVDAGGRVGVPVKNPSALGVPFSFVFDPAGRLVLNSAAGFESSYRVNADNTLTTVDAGVANKQAATCWIVGIGSTYYAVNTASNTITGFSSDDGRLSLLQPTGITAATAQGPIDIAASAGGRYVYVQDGQAGALTEYRVGADHSLTIIGTVGGLPVIDKASHGMEGLVAA